MTDSAEPNRLTIALIMLVIYPFHINLPSPVLACLLFLLNQIHRLSRCLIIVG
jgi:hypothetical protein